MNGTLSLLVGVKDGLAIFSLLIALLFKAFGQPIQPAFQRQPLALGPVGLGLEEEAALPLLNLQFRPSKPRRAGSADQQPCRQQRCQAEFPQSFHLFPLLCLDDNPILQDMAGNYKG